MDFGDTVLFLLEVVMKIITTIIAVATMGLAAMQSGYAATPAAASSPFEGAYGQIGVGYDSAKPLYTGGTSSGIHYNSVADKSNNFIGTFTAGYNFVVNPSFVLGIGAEYSPLHNSTKNITSTGVTTASTYNKNQSYNVFLSPGLVIDRDKLAYAKFGYAGAAAHTSINGSTTDYTGYSLGLGYRQFVNQTVFGFGETNYAKYGSEPDGAARTGTHTLSATNVVVGIGLKF
jgi:hypothetical protein